MIPRHARQGLSVHRATSLRLSAPSSPKSLLSLPQGVTPSLGRRCVVTSHNRSWGRRLSNAAQSRVRERSLATAAGDLNLDTIPYNQINGSTFPPFQAQGLPSQVFRSFDPSMPLMIPEAGPPGPMTKMNRDGIPGDTDDLLSVFDACIRVGKLERAMLVLKRINSVGSMSDEERIVIHNQYLRASLRQIRATNDQRQAESLHKWYELQIRNKGLPHTAETVACMLKTSLLSERGQRLKRLVKRYMGMAPGEAGLQVLNMADILSGQDLAVITEICPTYNYAAEVDEDDGAVEAQVEEALSEATAERGLPIPKLQATAQQGLGLETLHRGLEMMNDLQDVDISKFPAADQREVQLQLERDSISSAMARWRAENKDRQQRGVNTIYSGGFSEASLPSHMASWLVMMEQRLKEEFRLIELSEQKTVKSDVDLERCFYGPLIQQADSSRLCAVTILTALNIGALAGADKGIPISKLVSNVAKLAQEDLAAQEKEKEQKSRRKRKVQYTGNAAEVDTSEKPGIRIQEPSNPDSDERVRKTWSLQARTQVGSILLKILIESAKVKVTKKDPLTQKDVSQYQPAFTHALQLRGGRKIGMLVFNPSLVEQLKREPLGDYLAKHLPMVVGPKPWKGLQDGGFLEGKTSVIRVQPGDVEQTLYTKAAIKAGDFNTVFKGLDVLGKTAWRVNKDVLGVMMEAWNRGEEIANIPPSNPKLELPPEPDSAEDPQAYRRWVQTVKTIEGERSGLHSQRCFMNLQLEIARAFRNQTIYFPHNVDYRGRAYPIPTYLNHMGADHTRGLLKFATGKELGARGLRWLKIHMANVYGLDKASFDEREAFTTENMPNIIESVENPLDGSGWWLKADDPWQCLATCYELKAAHDLPDPTKYVSHLPVHQDGTCNGLQHYAALGGDTWGARQVNLEPGDRPADVYSAVAELVKDLIAKDVKEDNPMAKAMDGRITRKVVKQTVMTNVYGVTFQGAKKQVCKQIDALYPTLGEDNGMSNMILSSYTAVQIFKALASMFRGAHDIQYWLGEIGSRCCRALTPAQLDQIASEFKAEEAKSSLRKGNTARSRGAKAAGKKGKAGLDELTKNFRSTVVWTTPLRMPVVQPYRRASMKEIRTCLQALVYPVGNQTDPVNRKKQLQGFPPNFIHSLDASHMLLSALQCNELGLDFAAVHDSFWTHAADVDVMNEVLREAFIQIHEEDVVGRLAAEFKARHHGSLYLAYIDADSPVAMKIKDLRKNSKLTPKEELLLEHKRNTLRLSGNPWDLEAAKQIVTPASVYEDMKAAEEDVTVKEEFKEMELGAVPDKVDEEVDGLSQDEMRDDEDDMGTEVKATAAKKPGKRLEVWLPLTIPDIPKKGDFDVTRLRGSKYFFS